MKRRTLFLLAATLLSSLSAIRGEENTLAKELFRGGVDAFYEGRPKDAVEAFDRLIVVAPEMKPQLWQRGLALYYVENYQAGRKQFEAHQEVNSADVENAAWHFICVARADNVEAARKALIPIEGDARIPMKEVHDLFAGKTDADAVLKAAGTGEGQELRNQLCYAHLYLGLYYEALGDEAKAREHMVKAARDYSMDHYMGTCAQVHVKLRGW